MKLFKRIDIATETEIHQYIRDERLIRLANTVVIDTGDELLLVKYNKDELTRINDISTHAVLHDNSFVTVPAFKRLSAKRILSYYNKNVRIMADPKPVTGVSSFMMSFFNQK